MMKNLLTFASVAKKTTQLLSTVARLRLLLVMLLTLTVSANAWGAEEVVYTLTPASGSNNSYAGNCDVTIDDITWNLTGNSTTTYWRIGGKSITNVDRALYSKTAIQEDISKIVISHGDASSITVNSVELIVSTDADGTGTTISSLEGSFSANSTMTFTRPAGTSWANAYYKFVYNVTVSGSSNKFVEFQEAEFYAETAPAVQYSITFNAGSGTCDTESLTETSAGAGVILPTATIDCGDVAWTFAGWAEASVATETAEAPSTLYEAGDTYKPTSNITLYAVYKRTEEGEGSGGGDVTESVDFSTKSYSDGQEVSSYEGTNFSVTFDKGTNSNAPKYYNSGTAIRVYAGGYFIVSSEATITKIVLTFGSSDKTNTITTNIDTYSNGTWTGSATSVKFTIGGTKEHRRIQAIEVTTSGGGSSSTTYYHSTPECSTETLVSLNPNGGEINGNGDTQTIQTENGTLTLPEPTRDCYTFTNWNTKENGTGESFAAGEIADWDSENTTLYAQWTQNTYTITWKNGDAVLETDNNVLCGAIPTYDGAIPTKTATAQYTYSFNGWNPEIYAANKDQVYTAQFASTTRQYTVTFDANGHGSAPANQTVDYGTKVTEPSAPTATGYTFGGWYKEAGCANAWNFTTDVVTGNITLYAKWTAKALTNYRTFCDVVCDAYSFHTGSDDNREEWLKEAIKCFVEAEGGFEHEWQIKDYIIPNDDDKFFVGNYGYFYNDNLGIGGANGKSRSVVSDWGNMYLAPAMDENDAPGTPRLGHAKGAKGTLRIFEDSNWDNLFVGFIPDGYKLKFGNEEYTFAKTTGTEYRSDVVQYNSTNADKNVSVGVVDADGKYVATNHTQEMRHIFLNTGGTSYWEADNVDNFALYDITNETFTCLMHKTGYPNIYEGWVPTTCAKIIFVRLKSSTIDWNNKHNQTVDITLDATKNLYTINNWNQENDKSGGTWSVYERYGQFAMHDNSKSKNWYVHFVPHYELTYDKNADDATGKMDIQTVAVDAADQKVIVADCGFTRLGYEFIKWKYDETLNYTAGVSITLNKDITLYALWQAKNITITWNPNGGTVSPTSSTYTYNGTPVELPIPTRANYIFNGWFTDPSGGTQIPDVGNTNKPTEDVIYYAQWTEKATPTFAWSAATCTAALEADNTFPTLNNPDGLTPITYESSNTDVATINAEGIITLVAKGTTTITATGAETDTYKSATDFYELTVVESNCRWVEVTDNATLEDGDEVVITMGKSGKTYALPNAKRTTTDPAPEATDVTSEIVGNEMTFVANNVRWTVERDGDYLKSQSQLRYLSVSIGTNSWRSPADNTTSTYSGQTLKFYKRECLDPTEVWVEGNLTNVTCDPQLPQIIAKDGGSITLTFEAVDGYTLPNEVTVTNATKTWDQETGKLTISNPTDNVLVTINAVKLHTITWMVGSSSLLTEEVANATGVTKTPTDDPANNAIGNCANAFMGWSETPLGSTEGQSAPADLCTAAQMKSKHTSVTGDKTFYAVFATAITTPGTSITEEETYSHTITSKTWEATGVATLNGISWTLDDNGDYYGYESTKGQQVGSSKKPAKSMTLTTSGFASASKITSVTINTSGASGTNAKVSVKVGGTSYSCNSNATLSITTSATDYKFTGNATGDIVISWTQTTSTAIYFKSITVEYSNTTTTPDVTTYSNYVTNCCALAPATDLTVSGTTANSATLTWTAPSSTTGITKLQVRNAETDAVVVDDIAVNTTTVTITELTECTSYQYYVVSVGDCEVFSNTVTATPFSGAKTVNYDYNGGSGPIASFTTNCSEQEIILPSANRTGYTFEGWYTAATGGTRVGGAGDKYDPTTSPITIYAQWTINQYTVTWNPNGGKWGESTANIIHTYDYGAKINRPADPTRDGYRFTGWNATIASTMPATNITYTAQWKQNYTITFHDGDDTTPWTQTIDAESIDLNTYVGTHACGEYNFAGWSTDATQYNDQTANITTWVTGTYTPTANIHLYAVYVKGDLATDFTLNCDGGVYEIWEKGHNQHMAGRQNGGGDKFYTTEYWDANNSESNGAPFTITKVADNTYTLQNADGQYITRDSYYEDELEIEETWENADRYKWTISYGTNGTWRFTNKAATSYALVYYDNRYFELRSASSVTAGNTTTYDLELTPAQTNVYQSNPNCGPYTITFVTHDGEFVQGNYKYSTAVTSNLTEPTISKFPSAYLEGYDFAGWKDGSPQDEINYEPLLKKPDDNLVVSSNKTYHAVYYYYDEEEDIDWSEEFTTGIYADVNGIKYFLAGTPDRGTMSSTTDCGYVSEVTITPGTGENAGKYKITVNSVGMAPEAGETDLVAGTAWWTITETSAGSGEYKISGEDKRNIVLRNSSFGHYSYNAGSSYGEGYYYPRFGKCLEHHWTSTPTPKPSIKLSGDIYITATKDHAIRATETIKVVANNLSAGESITLTSTSSDVYFSTDRTFNFAAGQAAGQKPTTSLTLPTDAEGNLATTDVYIHYMPSSEGDGVPANVIISANLETPNPSITDDHTIHVRNLPAKFVIATKVGATWYALPANMTGDTNPLAEVIEVDEITMTATAPNTSTYTLWPVKTTNGTGNRYAEYGDRVRFAAVNYEQRGLWANNNNSSSAIRNYAVINSLGADGLAAYEWKVTTTVVDGHWQYTLQTDQTQNQNYLRYWTSAEGTPVGPKWGTYNAGENKLYFLPVTETQPFEYDVVEWYPTKMLIQTDAAITSPTVKVGGEEIASPELTSKGGELYEISNLPLETNPNEVLQVSFTADAVNYVNAKVVPIILSREAKSITGEPFTTLTQKVYQYADVVVRDGATLTIDGGTDVANTLLGMTIYPTAKVSVAEGKKLSVHNLTFFGGIDEIYDGSAYTINKYGVPQLSLKGTLNKTITNMDYIMRVDLEQMYQIGVPYDVNLEDITYWDGTSIDLGEELYVSAYDGQKRANLESAWVWEVYFAEKVMKAGIGYTISADMQAGVGNEYSIIRLPMKSNIASGNTEAEEDKTVQVFAYANTNDVEITDNNKGWNYLSNPYMAAISGAEADSKLVVGFLDRNDVAEPWKWVEDNYRYVTIPSDDGTYHYQQKFRDATLLPFKSFFLQIATDGELSFDLASRQSAPARYLQSNNEQREVEFEVLLANDTRSDNLGFLIGEDYTPAYEINADLEKMIGSMSVYTIYNGYNLAYNALSPTNAAEQIPIGYVVPTVGEYTFALDESSDIEDVEHIYLIDYETSAITDLVTDVYTFTTLEQKSDTRFAINVALKSKDNTATGLDNMNTNSELPTKFIYQDKMYILHHGVIYDATGKRVITINK